MRFSVRPARWPCSPTPNTRSLSSWPNGTIHPGEPNDFVVRNVAEIANVFGIVVAR
jgi:hypothetical protein